MSGHKYACMSGLSPPSLDGTSLFSLTEVITAHGTALAALYVDTPLALTPY